MFTDWWRGHLDSVQTEPRPRDVYLGGTCGQSSWRDDVAIPLLLYALLLTSHMILYRIFVSYIHVKTFDKLQL